MLKRVKKLATTNMNEVWEGYYGDSRVAIKYPVGEDMLTQLRFVKEAKYWKDVSDLNIDGVVKIVAIDEDEPWCAVEYIEGETLDKYLAQSDYREISRRMLEVLNIMRIVHSKGFLHLDIKPSNIFVDQFGDVRIADWGLAVRVFRKLEDEEYKFIGTPTYAPPELWDPANYGKPDVRSDVYELGTTFYRVLTKQLPFTTREEVLSGKIPPFPDDIPVPLKNIILRAIKPEKDERFGNVDDMYRALQQWLGSEKILERGIYKSKFKTSLAIVRDAGSYRYISDPPTRVQGEIIRIEGRKVITNIENVFVSVGFRKKVKHEAKAYHLSGVVLGKKRLGTLDFGDRDVVYVDFDGSALESVEKFFRFISYLRAMKVKMKTKRGGEYINEEAHRVLIKRKLPERRIDIVAYYGMRRVHLRLIPEGHTHDYDIIIDSEEKYERAKLWYKIVGCKV